MKTPPLTILTEEGTQSVLLGHLRGRYKSPGGGTDEEASIGLYLNENISDSPYSYCYYGDSSGFCGHSSPFETDIPVEFAILEGWYEYRIAPHFWVTSESMDVSKEIKDSNLRKLFKTRHDAFSVAVEYFKNKETIRLMVYGSNREKHESDRLFYPEEPTPPEVPDLGLDEELFKID